MRLRGEGDLLGTRQSGIPGFRVARLEFHGKLLAPARDHAALTLSRDPDLASPRGEALRHLLINTTRWAMIIATPLYLLCAFHLDDLLVS